ncbi:hypothetical protein [Streptomyces sp. NBC_00076]|uniref:hypothetical protein n=1 Tax=Streptomyces sp. NBC_00076 TaxID=2975642 RepID=UPI00324F5ED6
MRRVAPAVEAAAEHTEVWRAAAEHTKVWWAAAGVMAAVGGWRGRTAVAVASPRAGS